MNAYRELLDHYVERYNARDLDAVAELYAEDAVQLMPDGVFRGRDVIRRRLDADLDACPDAVHTVLSYVEQGDAFADEFRFAGTHTGTLRLPDGTEVAPTGRPIEVRGMELVVMRDGKIVVDNLYYDLMGLGAQIGLFPQAAVA